MQTPINRPSIVPSRRTKLLVASRHNPLPENDGAGAYLHDLLSYLASQNFDIRLLWLEAEGSVTRTGRWATPASYRGIADLHIIHARKIGYTHFFPHIWWLPQKARLFHAAKKTLQTLHLFPSAPPSSRSASPHAPGPSPAQIWSALPSPAEDAFFRQHLHAFRPDSVLVNYCWLAPLLPPCGNIPTAILTNDVVSHRLRPNPSSFPDPGTPFGETTLLRQARHILAISDDDAAAFRKMLGMHSIKLVPKASRANPLTATPIPGRILLVGSGNTYNREGLTWFLEKIWPQILPLAPDAHLHICGSLSEAVENTPLRVTLRGRVPDLLPEYTAASIVIVPLLNGTGVKIKLVEAAGHGKPIVTTSIGLQGLPFLAPATLCADQPADFARALLHLLPNQTLQRDLSQRTLAAIREHLAPEKTYAAATAALSAAPA